MSQTTSPFAILGIALLIAGGSTPPYAIADVSLPPPEGKTYVEVANLPWDAADRSILEGADPAAEPGDIIEHDLATTPGGFSVTVNQDGTFRLGSTDDGTEQSFAYRLWRNANATWYGPETVTLTSTLPETTEPVFIGAVPLAPPVGKVYVEVGELPWDAGHLSILEGANPPAVEGDIIRHDAVTTPDGTPVTVFPDGTFEIASGEEGSLTFEYSLWRADTWTWSGPETVTVRDDGILSSSEGVVELVEEGNDTLSMTATVSGIEPPWLVVNLTEEGRDTVTASINVPVAATVTLQEVGGDAVLNDDLWLTIQITITPTWTKVPTDG